jgi:hypothetical protein
MHRVDHQLECRINDRARLLGVEVLHQIHRALDIGEQRRDRLAPALHDGLRISLCRDANCLGLCVGGDRASGWRSERRCALAAELRVRNILKTAGPAAVLEGRATLIAEFEAL